MSLSPGHVFWLFGLSGSGKSTLAAGLATDLRARQLPVFELDGDALRAGLNKGFGFSLEERTENIRRAAEIAKLASRSSLHVVASFITPLESHRQLVVDIVGRAELSLIYVDAPMNVCRERDVKGLYAKAAAGQVQKMTGMTSAFEPSSASNLTLFTARESVAETRQRLFGYALSRLQRT
jgi:adenylyl-sulfate kinase